MQPRPMAETSSLFFPCCRFCIRHHRCPCTLRSSDPAPTALILRRSEIAVLQCVAKLCRRHSDDAPENFAEVARVLVANVEADLDQAAFGFADELLGAGDPFAGDELQRRHAGGLLEDTREVKGA